LVTIRLPSMLTSYTGGNSIFKLNSVNVKDLLDELDDMFPGIKFRFINELNQIRPHMCIYVNGVQIDEVNYPIRDEDMVFIAQALSGG